MAFRRRGRFVRRRRFRRRGSSRGFTKRVMRVMYKQAETKFYIRNIATQITSSANGEYLFIDGITQGPGSEQRIGNQIRIKNWSIDFVATYTAGTTGGANAWLRFMILYPRKGLTSVDIQNYLTASNPGLGARADPDQFLTLYDRKINLTDNSKGGSGPIGTRMKWSKYRKMQKCTFEDASGVPDNQPVVYMYSTASTLSNSYVTVNGTISTSYKDV